MARAKAAEDADGEELPLLYGLDGMEKTNAVLEMRPDGPMLTCPGPSGYTVKWGPGATHSPNQHAPLGRRPL